MVGALAACPEPSRARGRKGRQAMADESAEITLNNNNSGRFELVQPFKAENVSTTTSTSSQTLDVKPLSQTLEVKPLSQTSNQALELKPVNVDSRQEIAYTDPIRTDASSTLDLKPVAMDVCVRTGQASLPPTHVCEPYHHRVALTVLGVELFGLAWSGDSQTIVDDRRSKPAIAWGEVTPAPSMHVGLPQHSPPDHHPGALHRPRGRERGGLRIRLAD
jgi:hypothetical protein